MPGPKKAQRTKGNVKPSSSSQAAQLLAASGHAATGFIGFSQQPAFVPVSETFDEAESALDADFRLVLRKLSKRDSVTKIKALQEFASLCSSKDEDVIKSVVFFWPRIYNKVAIDVDHKVRELTQKATAAMMSRVGKAVTPILKSIMGMWMVSTCDPYPTVASAADRAFTSHFPGHKQSKVIQFCQAEILECLLKNIMNHSKQTLSDPQTTSDEDMEGKYQRVVSCSLQALRKVITILSPDHVTTTLSHDLTTLLESSAFWKHGKSDVSMVKANMLGLLAGVNQVCPVAAVSSMGKITPFVVSFLDCTEPAIVQCVWDAFLTLISGHKDCWQHVNWQKAVWPRLKRVLESGCSGQARVVAPCLLPVMSKIPNLNFVQFFESFRLGLVGDSFTTPYEMSALVKSFQECMLFAVKYLHAQNRTTEISNLVLDQMLTIVQASLTEPKAHLSKTELYAEINSLMVAVADIDMETEWSFWKDLSVFTIGRLQVEFERAKKSGPGSPELFQRLVLLMKGLLFRESASAARKERVKFSAPAEETSAVDTPRPAQYAGKEAARLSEAAEGFVAGVYVATFKMATVNERVSPQFASLFSEFVAMHISSRAALRLNDKSDGTRIRVSQDLGLEPGLSITRDKGKDLVEQLKARLSDTGSGGGSDANSYRGFVVDHLVPFLFYAKEEQCLQTARSVVAALFAFLLRVDDESCRAIITAIMDGIPEPFITHQMIEHTLLMAKAIPACKALAEGPELAQHIEQLLATATDGAESSGQEDVWTMLTSVVSFLGDGDDDTASHPCLDVVMSSCVTTLKHLATQGRRKPGQDSAGQETTALTAVVRLVQVLLEKRKILAHAQLGEFVVNFLAVLLESPLSEEAETSLLERVWLVGLGRVLQNKSHAEIELRVAKMCNMIRAKAGQRTFDLASLAHVQRVVKLLISSLISPWDEEAERNDIASRLGSMTLSKEEEEDGREEDKFSDADLASISAAVDSLLVEDMTSTHSFDAHYNYLYISKKLQGLPAFGVRTTEPAKLGDSLLMGYLHNLSVLETYTYLYCRDNSGQPSTGAGPVSDAQLLCLRRLCGTLVLLEAEEKMGEGSNLASHPNLLADFRSGLYKCVDRLNSGQLRDLVLGTCEEKSTESCPLEKLGASDVLTSIQGKRGVSRKQPSVFKDCFLSLRTSFLCNCGLSESVRGGVMELLTGSMISGDSVCQALSLACGDLLKADGDEQLNLAALATCFSGFMSFAQDYGQLEESVKVSMFDELLEVVTRLKERGIHLLSSSDARPVSPQVLELNVSLARSLTDLAVPSSERFWEFALCTLVEWIHFLSEGQVELKRDARMQALAVSVWELSLKAAQTFSAEDAGIAAGEGEKAEEGDSSSCVTEKARTEWNEFFSEGMFSPLLPLFVSLVSAPQGWARGVWSLLLTPLSSATSLCPAWLVLAHQLPPHLTATDTSSLSDDLKTLLNHAGPMLMSRDRGVEVTAYLLLKAAVDEIAKQDMGSDEDVRGAKGGNGSNEEEEETKSPPEALMTQIKLAGRFLECLKVVQVDNHIVMDEGTEERSQAMGYLLAWRLLLLLFKSAAGELRAKYAQHFKAQGCVSSLLDHLFRLMPQHPSSSILEADTELAVSPGESAVVPDLEVEWLALQVYRDCLDILPALVRAWWVDQDRKASNFVDQFTTQYLSMGLIRRQIASAQGGADLEGITIKTRPAAREVLATCEMAEVTVNLTITLPENFPLGKLEVSCDKRVGVSQAQWDRWLLQLNIFLQHQNGSIMEGLRLWKASLDKKFEGIEDCMICFSVIHGTTLQLPRLTCRTCRKKFHSSCLYKWFNTSQKSSCPLCRNLF